LAESEPISRDLYVIRDDEGFEWLFHGRVAHEFGLIADTVCPLLHDFFHAAVAETLYAAQLSLAALIRASRQPSARYQERLHEKGHGETDAQLAVLIAGMRGLVDDRAYAANLLELRYARRHEGRIALRHWLLHKGFGAAVADEVLAAHLDDVDPLRDAFLLLEKRYGNDRPPDGCRSPRPASAWNFLVSRGYPADIAQRALRRFFEGDSEYSQD